MISLRFEDDGENVKVFVATDITLHRRMPTNPNSLLRQMSKSARNGQPGRAYVKGFEHKRVGNVVHISAFIPFSEEDKLRMKNLERQGKKIKFIIPEPMPLYARD